MNRSQPTVAVLGSGLAARVAAAVVAEAGVDVALHAGEAPGIFGIWNGLGSIFGPPSDPPAASAGAVERRTSETRAFEPSRRKRWRRLLERRGAYHPYRRLGLELDDVDRAIDASLPYLPDGAMRRTNDGTIVPGPHGQPSSPDLIFPSLRPLDFAGGARVGLIRYPELNGWDADATALQLDRADGLEARPVDSPLFDDAPPGHGVRAARWFDELAADRASELTEQCRALVADHDLDRLVFPPMVGATLERHGEVWAMLDDAIDAAIAEFPAATDPVFGWRLFRACREMLDETAIRSRPAAESVALSGRRAVGVVDADGNSRPCDAAVLATGRWFGGGLPGGPPMLEPLTGAPIWLDGAPMSADDELYPPDFLDRLPWDDHELFRAGLQVDADGRILTRDGEPFDNVYAAGRILGGFNPFADACAFGVELATGLTVGRRAADSVDDVSNQHNEPDSLQRQ